MHINIKRLTKKAKKYGYNIIVNVNNDASRKTYTIIDSIDNTDIFLTNDLVSLRNEIDKLTTPIDESYLYFDSETVFTLD